jgi:hypothetical protein
MRQYLSFSVGMQKAGMKSRKKRAELELMAVNKFFLSFGNSLLKFEFKVYFFLISIKVKAIATRRWKLPRPGKLIGGNLAKIGLSFLF